MQFQKPISYVFLTSLVLFFVLSGCTTNQPPPNNQNTSQNITTSNSSTNVQIPVNPQTYANINKLSYAGIKFGSDNSTLIMIEFTDYQCNFCRSFWQNQEVLLKNEYVDSGKLQIVYKNLPARNIHPAAEAAALAVICAEDQNKGKQMIDKLFSEQAKHGTGFVGIYSDDLRNWSKDINLSSDFETCVLGPSAKERLVQDELTATNLSISATPSFLIGRRDGKMGVVPIIGAQSYEIFNSTIQVFLQTEN